MMKSSHSMAKLTTWMNRFKKSSLFFIFIYFSSMMIVLGNGSSFLGRYLGDYFTPVANIVGLNTTWNFFSPDPAHTMYLRYTVYFEDEFGNPKQEALQNLFPSSETNNNLTTHIRRLSYMMRFLTSSTERLHKFFVPWICTQNPGATRVQTEILLSRIPSLEVASSLSNSNYDDLVQQEEVNQNVFSCR